MLSSETTSPLGTKYKRVLCSRHISLILSMLLPPLATSYQSLVTSHQSPKKEKYAMKNKWKLIFLFVLMAISLYRANLTDDLFTQGTALFVTILFVISAWHCWKK